MKILRDLRLLYKRTLFQTLRNMIWVIVGLSTPILYLVFFTPLLNKLSGGPGFSRGHVLDVFLPGILAIMAFGAGNALGFSIIFELQSGMIERLRVTPASRFSLLIAPTLANLTTQFAFMAMVVVIGAKLGFHVHLAGLILSFVLLAMLMVIFSSFSASMALITKDISSFAAVVNGLNLPLILLSGVLLPLSLAPAWMVVIAHANPLYYVVEASRTLVMGTYDAPDIRLAFVVLVPLTTLAVWWATGVYRKAVA